MFELVLIYCLASQADRCIERRQPIGYEAPGLACTVQAQEIAQEYVRSHPDWRLKGWRCEKDIPQRAPA